MAYSANRGSSNGNMSYNQEQMSPEDAKKQKQQEAIPVIEYKLPKFINKNIENVKTTLTNNGMKYIIIGNGNKVIKQSPNKRQTHKCRWQADSC